MESIRLNVRIPFSVCIIITKVLQRRDNAFVDLARYNAMDPRQLGIESDALSTLHGMLGEISSIARASGITTLRHEVAASAAHVTGENRMKEPKCPGRTTPLHAHARTACQARMRSNRMKSVGDQGRREPPVSLDGRRRTPVQVIRKCGS
jgi:hypothetical protein